MNVGQIASELAHAVVERLGLELWQRLGERDRRLIEACCFDAAELEAELASAGEPVPRESVGPAATEGVDGSAGALAANPSVVEQVRREKMHIQAQLSNLSAVAASVAQQALWEAATRMLARAGLLLAAA